MPNQNYFVCPRCGQVHDVDPRPQCEPYVDPRVEEIKYLLAQIPKPTLDDLIDMSMIGMKKGRVPHVRKIIEKFIESVRSF